jgi:pyruvate,water dikinase
MAEFIYTESEAPPNPTLIGWKSLNLFKMGAAGIPVPPSLALTTCAFSACVGSGGALSGAEEFPGARDRIKNSPFPPALDGELQRAWDWGRSKCIQPFGVSIRSSGCAEDLPRASFAGQFESFLNVRSFDDFLDRVRDVWLSACSDRVLQYMAQHNLGATVPRMAVLVQPTIPADVSGVAFGCDPASGRTDVIRIEATLGMGDILVGGSVRPDVWTVAKTRGGVLSLATGTKDVRSVCGCAPWPGVLQVPVPVHQISAPCLTESEVNLVANVVVAIEKVLGGPIDVEWCLHKSKVIVLQARPVTA